MATTQGQWVRFVLSGDFGSEDGDQTTDTPKDAQVQPLLDSFTRRAILKRPCIATDGEINLTGADLEAWNEWSGRSVAEEFKATKAGQDIVAGNGGQGVVIEKEADNVRYRYSGPGKSSVAASDPAALTNLQLAKRAETSITCIADAIANGPLPSSSDLTFASRRSAINAARAEETGDDCTVVTIAGGGFTEVV